MEFDFTNFCEPTAEVLRASILEVCDTMLNPPANLLGISGIKKFSKEIKKWSKFDEEKLKNAGYTNYYQISADGGSGGGIFRNMYGVFLCEIAKKLDYRLSEIGQLFIETSIVWDRVAEDMKTLSISGNVNLLDFMSENISKLYDVEEDLFGRLKKIVS